MIDLKRMINSILAHNISIFLNNFFKSLKAKICVDGIVSKINKVYELIFDPKII